MCYCFPGYHEFDGVCIRNGEPPELSTEVISSNSIELNWTKEIS